MELKKLEHMKSVVEAMNNILNLLAKNDDNLIVEKIKEVNRNYKQDVLDVEKLAEQKRVSIRIEPSSTYLYHFKDVFGFWADSTIEYYNRINLSGNFDRYNFGRQILRGLYSIEHYPRISEPTKKNLVKCPERLKYDLRAYTTIDTYQNGTFKIEADEELFWLIKFIKDFNKTLEMWQKKETAF